MMSSTDPRARAWPPTIASTYTYLLLAGAVTIWTGIAIEADSVQLAGMAVCIVGFARLAVAGWRISRDR